MIKIANIYDDLLNLYGDSGNYKALAYHLREIGEDVTVEKIRFGDKIHFNKYDMIFIGSGTEKNLLLALDDILPYKDDILKYKSQGGFLVSTGNSIELFGKAIVTAEYTKNALDIFNYTATYQKERTVKDVCMQTSLFDGDIIGFENHLGTLDRDENMILEDHFLLTYTIGPLLVRNPRLTDYLIRKLLRKDVTNADYSFEEHAYQLTIQTIKNKTEN